MMKKCRTNEHETDFAKRVSPGEFFAISETTHMPSLRRALIQRDIHVEVLHPISMTKEQYQEYRKHWAVYEAISIAKATKQNGPK